MVVAPVEAATVLVMVLVLARMLVLVLVLALVLTNTQVVTVWVGVEAAADAAVSAEVLAAAAVAGASKPPSADAAARAVLGWRASAAHSIWAQLLPVMPMTGGLQAQTSLQVSNHSPSQLSCSSMERTMMYSLHLQL
jgi:hypothetical protein